ncbi:MAG TPA: 30S ribosomal protein S6 [Candidatus Paceibacterota bacterium]|jgi:ribosomal protein S6|nr:30S ribosomal protein S6 [Candidatus Paceibacterota bacterium]
MANDTNNEEKEKKLYELALLLKNESDLAGVLTLLKQLNGEVASEPRAKRLMLAYKIKGHTEAVFVSFTFHAFPADAKNMEEDLNTRQDVIRFMIMVAPPPSTQPTGPMTALPPMKRGRPAGIRAGAPGESKPTPRLAGPISNEALEKKIEEILQ